MALPSPDLGGYKNKITSSGDSFNSILSPIFTLSAISVLGIGSFSIEGISLAQNLLGPWNGISISLGAILAILAVAASYFLNDRDFIDFFSELFRG